MKPIHSILYLFDSVAEPDPGLERACALAAEAQARLTLLTVAARVPAAGRLTQEQMDQAIRAHHLGRMASQLEGLGQRGDAVLAVAFGRLYEEAIRAVLRGGHDLVLKMVEPGGGLWERMLGSQEMHLLRKCPCPVWLLRPGEPYPYRRILAAVDFDVSAAESENQILNRRILEWGSALALAQFSELHLVHVWDAPAEGMLRLWGSDDGDPAVTDYVVQTRAHHAAWLEGLLRDLSEWIGPDAYGYLSIVRHLPRGVAAEVIPRLAEEIGADIIVMGTLGRGGIPGMLIGNTAETIINRCGRAVLAIKPPDFVTPVTVD